ncbi:thiopeptide-type bacteriocin biosynthesis protein [Streptomyces sp. NPDC091027]|uniref:thiopeptide-type bacteriocin biosynthesis protein n=1 Tax=Streptomyces sp. NPDC091027 TaxID=3365971 RepID=UPI0038219C6A
MTTTPTGTAAGTWQSHHLFLHAGTEDTDRFLTADAAPLLDALVASGEAADWFFIRYGQDGPHVRIRVRATGTAPGGAPSRLTELPGLLERAARRVPAVPGPWPSRHGEVRAVPYAPETLRYGGPRALPVAEAVFGASTRTALDAMRALPAENASAARLTAAADLAHTTAYALGMDRLAGARWLRAHAAGWRWVTEVPLLPGAAVHTRVNTVHAAQRTVLGERAAGLRDRLRARTAAAWLVRWADRVREADALLDGLDGPARESVWGSQLHMLLNRLGVNPDEERAVCRLAARTLLETGEPGGFFPPGHAAPDVQYLERSKFQIGRGEDSALRPLPGPATTAAEPASTAARPAAEPATIRPAAVDVPLPEGPLPEVSLGDALRARASLRGALTGPLDAGTLGTLLWNSLAGSGRAGHGLSDDPARGPAPRPYPSAGALYTARVRLLVLDVAGLPAGTYDCVPERRALRRVGPAAPVEDIAALSTYLSRPPSDPDWIGVAQAPVVLALYVELGLLRRRYGLRALRLGLLETGHLAQTLLLTASALGLAGTPLGGFHDDLAHELLGLRDPDQPLQYLLPLGRRPDRDDG